MNIEIIKSKIDWDAFLENVDDYDFYHTYDYHQISKSESDEAVLIKYKNNDIIIGLPLLIRKIEGTDYYDAISVYGYAGPIGSNTPMNFDTSNYESAFVDFCNQENIISVFCEAKSFYNISENSFSNLGASSYFGDLSYVGKIVNINVTIPIDDQRSKYQRRLKSHINRANRLLSLKVAETKEDFQKFKVLYYENMKRIKAKDIYFFSDKYFEKLSSSKDFETEILLAIDNETKKVIAGCLFVKTNKMVQYHLSGSDEKFLHLNANKFLIDKMRLKASNDGFKNFNLGGGLGANDNDSLFRFKSTFSDEYHPFFVWKLITNKQAYEKICIRNKISDNNSTFFHYID